MCTETQPPHAGTGTGVAGLDDILCGGFTPNRFYLVEGVPGSGKTTLALQFLLEGVRHGEPVLYVTLSESDAELRASATGHGWNLDGIHIRELVPSEEGLLPQEQYTMFHPSEVELGETTKRILADVEQLKPKRVVIDSLSELRLLSGNPLRFRRQILAMKQFFSGRESTVMVLDDLTSSERDLQVQSIAHAVISLEQVNPDFGPDRRRLRVVKYRGKQYRAGFHDYEIIKGGLDVFPRLVAADHRQPQKSEQLPSGIPQLDALIGGGIERGTSTLLMGAPGTGKSSLATVFAVAAADRGYRACMFIFDENESTLLTRSEGIGIGLKKHVDSGLIRIQAVDPAELSPGEFAHAIREAVENDQTQVIVVDSLNGYLNAMPGERFLVIQLHEVLTYLSQLGVATIMVGAQQGLIGPMTSPVEISYLADSVILLRYFELRGEVRQAISVIKKRSGNHERSIREFRLGKEGIHVGEPLRNFRGVLTGVPIYEEHAPPSGSAS